MKEAFWGVLIVVLGLFGIVVVNLFQNITVDNDRVYYVMKEATEAATLDAIDLAHYRLNGTIRIVEEKFIENLTRRFAENVSKGSYKIVVEDINEMPPKVSLRVETGVDLLNKGLIQREDSYKDDPFNIVNRVDAIIEAKYTKEDLEFGGIDPNVPEEPITDDVCKPTIVDEDDGCIDGDIMFTGHEEINIQNKICTGQTPPNNVSKKVNYKVCECGSWVEKSEILVASPRKNGREWVYEWVFYVEGKNRVINQVIIEKVLELQCTTGIQIYVPDDMDIINQNNATRLYEGKYYEKTSDNSGYEICPPEGIKIPIGMAFIAHPNYIPANSVNRNLIWESSNSNILEVVGVNPGMYCDLDRNPCYSIGKIESKNLGTTYIKVETTEINRDEFGKLIRRGQTSTCKVEVYDGKVESIGCEDINVEVGKSLPILAIPKPANATIKNYTYKVVDTTVATVSGNNVTGKAGGTTTLTITETNTGKTGTCTIRVPSPPEPPKSFSGSDYSGGSSTSSGGYWKLTDENGKVTYYSSYDKAKEAASKTKGGLNTISYKNSGSNTEIKYSEVTVSGTGGAVTEAMYNGNKDKQSTTIVTKNSAGTAITTIDKNGKVTQTLIPAPKPPSSGGGGGSGSSGGGGGGSSNSGNKTGTSHNWGNAKPGSYNPYVPSSKPSKGGGGCLDGNTKILTLDGYKNIKDINEGDMVLSYNYETNKNEFKEVTMVYKHINMKDVLYSLVVNNKVIKATRLHRFYVKTNNGYEYVKVEDLEIGDLLMDSNGNYHPIRKISSRFMISNYYDIEVKDNHNYYISRDNILVHNAISKR